MIISNVAPRPNAYNIPQKNQNSMADQPYSTPDEDPFNVRPYAQETTLKHRRSSMLDKWILEQHSQPSSDDAQHEPLDIPKLSFSRTLAFGSSSNPYLAYLELPRACSDPIVSKEDADSLISYDLVDDDDIPPNAIPEDPASEVPVTPIAPRTHKPSRHSLSPSFRNLSLNLRSNFPGAPSSINMEASSRAKARLSFFPRTPRSSTGPASSSETTTPQQYNRPSSLSTLTFSASHQPAKVLSSPSSSKWRPSVLGHFHQPSASQSSIAGSDAQYTPSRPSISSGDTYTTSSTSRTMTTLDSNILPTTPSKTSLFDSIRLRGNKSPRTFSTFSVASTSSVRLSTQQTGRITQEGPSNGTEHYTEYMSRQTAFTPKPGSMLDNLDDDSDLDAPPTYRFIKHESTRRPIPHSSSSSLPRVKFSSLNSRTRRKKKKLIISGVGATEARKFEGVRRWCENFGEIRQITRMPNGDLQIDFRDPEVADTVCRVRAKVFIAGVGSVQLSWISGNKR